MPNGPPSQSLEDKLISQFYDWELRGRGWAVYPEPVATEPPFRPFHGHYIAPEEGADDGRVPTILSSLYAWLAGGRQRVPPPPEATEEPEPAYLDNSDEHTEIQATLPQDLDVAKETVEQFLASLTYAGEALGFELLGTEKTITPIFTVPSLHAPRLLRQLEAHFPDAAFTATRGKLSDAWLSGGEGVIFELGLSEEFMRPLAALETDPYVGIAGVLSHLSRGECGIFQVLFEPARRPWAESIMNAVTDNQGGAFFVDNAELERFQRFSTRSSSRFGIAEYSRRRASAESALVRQAKRKIEKPLYAAVVRLAAKADTEARAWQLAKTLASVFRMFENPGGNSLIALDNGEYDPADHETDLLARRSRRCGMILNSDELCAFVHLPSPSVRSLKLARQLERTKAAPASAVHPAGLVIGENVHAGTSRQVSLTPEERVQHAHILGASGTGKSTLVFNLVLQGIERGEGMAVLDPHGDLVDRIIGHIPEHRVKDVVLLDASDEEFPIGFNILSAHSSLEKTLLASDLVSVFRRQATSWGDVMNSVLGNAILAFLESERGGTLLDLRRFLAEPNFRSEFLSAVRDSEVVYFWQKEFPLITGRPHVSLLSRLNAFLRPKPIRFMVGQKENRLDFSSIMDSGKVFLAKLPQGIIGEENAYLLGTLLVSKFQQLVIARQAMKAELRRDYTLYIDECHQFLTPSMATILAGARKYRLGLFLAHHHLHQLDGVPEVGSAVRGNTYTRIYFRASPEDARQLEGSLSFFEANDLQNLKRGEAICRIERSDCDFNLRIPAPKARSDAAFNKTRDTVVEASRSAYGTPRLSVEALLLPREETTPVPPPAAETRPVPVVAKPIVEKAADEPKPPVTVKKDIPAVSPLLGRGGKEHQYLQHLIKQLAIGLNFEVDVEKEIMDGTGSVDVLIRKAGRSFAFEISITTSVEHELSNIQKCLKAGCEEVVLVCNEEAKLVKARDAARALFPKEIEKITICLTDAIVSKLFEIAAKCKGTHSIINGRRTRVEYRPVSPAEAEDRRQALARITASSLKKLKVKS